MARTLNRQTRVPASSGQTDTSDGDGLSSHLGHDLVYGINNLATYCMPYPGYVQTPGEQQLFQNDAVSTSAESFLFEVPTILPRDFVRFAWTLGLQITGIGDDVVVDFVNVYLSPEPYRGKRRSGTGPYGSGYQNSDFSLDTSALGQPYGKSSFASGATVAAGSNDYHFFDNSAGSVGNLMPFLKPTHALSPLNQTWLIVTFDRHNAAAGTLFGSSTYLWDFTWWVLYE
jgi:hypothetical protein